MRVGETRVENKGRRREEGKVEGKGGCGNKDGEVLDGEKMPVERKC